MTKIYCYSLDFQKKEKEFDNLESLLKEVVGAKEQAENSLDNPNMSYRGFRLVSQEKMPELLAEVLTTRSDKIKNDYVENIADLEKKIKNLEKAERKNNVKMEVVTQDFEDEISKMNHKFTEDKELLEKEHAKEIEGHQKEFDLNIQSISDKYREDFNKLSDKRNTDIKTLVTKIEDYISETRKTVSEYNKNISTLKDNHNKEIERIHKENTTALQNVIKNKESLAVNVGNKLSRAIETTNRLALIVNKMVTDENKEMGTSNTPITLLKEKPTVPNKTYIKDLHKVLSEVVTDIEIEPLTYSVVFDSDKLLSDLSLGNDLKFEEIKVDSNEITKNKSDKVVVEQPKVKPEIVKEKEVVKEEPKSLKIKNHDVLTEKDYDKQSDIVKSVYLFDLNKLGVTPEDLKPHYSNLDNDLKNDVIQTKFLHRASESSMVYNDIKELVPQKVAEEKMQTIFSTKKGYNDFFGIVEENKKEELSKIIKEDVPESTKHASTTSFDWVQFKSKYIRTPYLELMFSKDSISLKEASGTLTIPATQLKNMIGMMKKLGYEKVYNNDALLTPDELLLIIVADGWLQNISALRKNTGDNLQSIMAELYPSWKNYIDTKK